MNLSLNTTSLNQQLEWKTSKGLVDYEQALFEMESRAVEIFKNNAPELVWCLEHPSIYTLGTSGKAEDIMNKDLCPIYQTGRGGQGTYHGPGQRVVYVMLNLQQRNPDIRQFVHKLELWVSQTLASFGINASPREGRVGLWVSRTSEIDDKIAAIGVRVKKWVTLHGLAINVHTDLKYYQGIVPCGIREHGVTSLHALGQKVTMEDLDHRLRQTFNLVFS